MTLVIIVHVIVCMALVFIVLLQHGRGADIGAAFGGSNQTLFGSTGAGTFLSKITTVAAIMFMLTSLSLAYLSSRRSSNTSVIRPAATAPLTAPAVPPGVPPATPPATPVAPAAPATPEAPVAPKP